MESKFRETTEKFLPINFPIAIEVKMENYNTFSKGFDKPYSEELMTLLTKSFSDVMLKNNLCFYKIFVGFERSTIIIDNPKEDVMLGKCVQYISSVFSSFMTNCFNNNYLKAYLDAMAKKYNKGEKIQMDLIKTFLTNRIFPIFSSLSYSIPKDNLEELEEAFIENYKKRFELDNYTNLEFVKPSVLFMKEQKIRKECVK
jgi:hypothetical protein